MALPAGPLMQLPPAQGTGPGHQAAVIAPVEAHPWAALPGLVLEVGGLVELLVVVDAEDSRRSEAWLRLRQPGE